MILLQLLTALILFLPGPLSAYQKGVALGLYDKDAAHSYKDELQEIRATGADHVSLVVSWYQKEIKSNDIYPRWEAAGAAPAVGDFETTPDHKLIQVIEEAHRTAPNSAPWSPKRNSGEG